jgi:arginyl-tRNA synthetase
MNPLSLIKDRFQLALEKIPGVGNESNALLGSIRPAQDSRFGDYQANCAMPLAGKLGKPAREIAGEIIAGLEVDDLCQKVEIAGPGFINLTLKDQWLLGALQQAYADEHLGITPVANPWTVVVDYSSPNVAKPMHVGHIRSTVIGDALARTLRFRGHQVITDNHLGDWGTQFGMIIHGYKHFLNPPAYAENPVNELARLYKLVRKLIDFQSARRDLPVLGEELEKLENFLQLKSAEAGEPKKSDKQAKKELESLRVKIAEHQEKLQQLRVLVQSVEQDPVLKQLAEQHPGIGEAVLQETSALHAGDPTNRQLWEKFFPHCRSDIQRIYQRLGIEFDYELGESFYQDQLQSVVDDLEARGFARTSEGAVCVFLENSDAPMIVQKKDGAFLYATTDLATIQYRVARWKADKILYVVDHRQHEHFEKLFAVADLWGYSEVELIHVSFGTVLGDDGKPYKTRSGDTVGLEGLLDEAESRAMAIAAEQNPDLTPTELASIARTVGIGGLKYADLSQNRATDYRFSYDKMLALKGNTATYLQYSYARVQGILRKLEVVPEQLRQIPGPFQFSVDLEKQLGLKLLQFEEAIDDVLVEYKPNVLCNYLFELTQKFFQFYDQCSVKDAETCQLRTSRLQLCDLTARTIRQGLDLLGIGVLDQM